MIDDELRPDDNFIVIISGAKGYLISALEEQFRMADIPAVWSGSMSELEKLDSNQILGYLMFLEENLLADNQLQVYIRDRATEEGLPLFVLGNDQEIKEIKNVIPAHLIQAEYQRPVNVKDTVANIDKYLADHEKVEQKIILAVDDSAVMLN